MKEQILDRFLRYVKVDTQSEFGVDKIPSTDKQFILANQIVEELKAIGLSEVEIDEHCYIMATLPANTDKKIPTVGFVAHIDTSPDFTATGCAPIVWENYEGGDLVLNEEENIVLRTEEFPEMVQFKGQTMITTNGMTLLGADDKAGVTEIVSAMEYLINHPEIKHGKIRICFTPDEEVGRGADLFDVEKFGAEWAYTMDGSLPGEIEYENFNAAYAAIDIQGKIVHPGSAKDKMINSMYIAADIIQTLKTEEVPEKTEGYEGFYHLLSVKGDVDKTELRYIIRDHDKEKFEAKKATVQNLVEQLNHTHNDCISLTLTDQYYNMAEKVRPVMHIVELAREAISNLGMTPITRPIRGGTDGSRLSFMGLPCPNIFAGGLNFHSRYEYVALESIVSATETIVEIAKLMESREW
ncbi:peptidase T [Aureispira anguillae]|uniref:Peptidase T n=1 Tax=Aureispira anguillae TaxID=2864201 RepID=A0A915YB47_9BACT|nr:peptidase T [Aureispira anguillae]BDS09833.1 peptidase T [Aureispira anguillae]